MNNSKNKLNSKKTGFLKVLVLVVLKNFIAILTPPNTNLWLHSWSQSQIIWLHSYNAQPKVAVHDRS